MIYDELEYREEAHICAEQQKNHLHYITDDESECSVCGARFSKKLASCPQCGAQFDSAETDEEEWYEEFDEECAWDEEEGW